MGSIVLRRAASGIQKQPNSAPQKMAGSSTKKRSLFTQVRIKNEINKQNQQGVKMINDYCVAENIGYGLFGKVKRVYRLENKVKKEYAMKIFSKSLMQKRRVFYKDETGKMVTKNGFQYFFRELSVYSKIHYQGLTSLYEVLINDETDKIYLIMELAARGQLIDWDDESQKWKFTQETRKRLLKENELRRLMRDITKSVYVLHQNNIIHRDIKPQNILFDEDSNVKLTDFGISLLSSETKIAQITGTQFFLAPESFLPEKEKVISGKPLDIWAMGITMYCFKYLQLPFSGSNYDQTIKQIQTKKLVLKDISKDLEELFLMMLERDPSKRITIEEMMKNKWLNFECDDLHQELQDEKVKINQSQEKLMASKAVVRKVQAVEISDSSSEESEQSSSQSVADTIVSSKMSQASRVSNLEESRRKVVVVEPAIVKTKVLDTNDD